MPQNGHAALQPTKCRVYKVYHIIPLHFTMNGHIILETGGGLATSAAHIGVYSSKVTIRPDDQPPGSTNHSLYMRFDRIIHYMRLVSEAVTMQNTIFKVDVGTYKVPRSNYSFSLQNTARVSRNERERPRWSRKRTIPQTGNPRFANVLPPLLPNYVHILM